jgi:WhiB family transcriptional regulator, redox-sensing transcriptional regulator
VSGAGLDLPKPPINDDEAWRSRARCAGASAEVGDYSLFFGPGQSIEFRQKTCGMCPVAWECFMFAVDNDHATGTWGGLTSRQRRDLLRLHAWRITPALRRDHAMKLRTLLNRSVNTYIRKDRRK